MIYGQSRLNPKLHAISWAEWQTPTAQPGTGRRGTFSAAFVSGQERHGILPRERPVPRHFKLSLHPARRRSLSGQAEAILLREGGSRQGGSVVVAR